ncbi:unnamed protein product [Lampetra fluviatilis]
MSAPSLGEQQQQHRGSCTRGGLVLRGYQLEGVEWLRRCREGQHGAILADEMGLGKTCQTIAFLLSLVRRDRVDRPFLILAPLSVTHNWQDEMKRMCQPAGRHDEEEEEGGGGDDDDEGKQQQEEEEDEEISIIVYLGDIEKRGKLQEKIKSGAFHILLTTYELCLKDAAFLGSLPWSVLVVDEGHRLKSQSSLLHQALLEFDIGQRVLLTGTPVQNNLAELYSLLSFVSAGTFAPEGLRAFVQRFAGVGSDPERASELGDLLGPFVLRRLKTEVAAELPAKTELVLYHGVSALQKQYYRAILSRDLDALEDPTTGARVRLMNILMQLRKCVDHPYLFNGAEPEPFVEGEHLVSASGKLLALDRILALLRREGHRALIFSQMTRMLDILQDFLEFRGYSYERLDGSVRGEERHLAIKSFGQKDIFVFLLSTRAGGVGLNLTAADTVVFVDSDFNPQNDAQAAARAHRIGQTRPVKVIRLIGRSTVEEVIYRRAEAKLRLTHAVTAQMREDSDSNDMKDESPKQLSEILLAGLGTLMESDEGSSVEMDLQAILGESRDGCWVIEEPPAEGVDAPPRRGALRRQTEDDRRILESADYLRAPASSSDLTALSLLRQDMNSRAGGAGGSSQSSAALALPVRPERLPLTEEERAKRKERRRQLDRERDRALAAKRARMDVERQRKKLALWKEAGYESLNVALRGEGAASDDASGSDEDVEGGASDEEEDEEGEGGQIRYVLGDVTLPDAPAGRNAIVVHCVDNSGRWGHGGLFSALDKRSTQPKRCYARAGKMGDLALGDAHLIPVDDRVSRAGGVDTLALVVAQSRDPNNVLSGISLAALETGLRRVRRAARRLRAGVHLPRIGHATPGFNWYATERLVRKHLVSRGVPTYIYYHPRRTRQGAAASTARPSSAPKPAASASSAASVASTTSVASAQTAAQSAATHKPGPSVSACIKPASAAALSPSSSSSSSSSSRPPPPSSSSSSPSLAAGPGDPNAAGSPSGQSDSWSLGFPDFMSGVRARFLGLPEAEAARLARYLVTFDGDVSAGVDADTTHLVTAGREPGSGDAETLREAVRRRPDLTVVTAAWLRACFSAREKLPCAPFVVDV